jgi:capsular polysaccharide biosynthesis protein
MLLMYVSLGVGLVIGIIFALVLHYLDDDVHDVEEVREILGVPCLGVIPAETDTAETEASQVA